jgi:hypothetical protein
VAHACNPSYSRGRDQADHDSKSAQIVSETLFLKTPSQKRAGGVAQGVGPEFKPQYHSTAKKKEKKNASQTIISRYLQITLTKVLLNSTKGRENYY